MNFNTYASWKEGSKEFGAVKFVGNKNEADAFDENMRRIGSWMGDVGYGSPIKKRRAPRAIVRKPQTESEYVFGGSGLSFEPVKRLTSKSKTGFKTAQNPVRQRKGWKIQTGSGNGWSDIKFSSGSDFYRTQYFKTKPAAQSELNALARIHGDPESYRIVPAATEEDFDLYNPVHRKNPVRQRIAVSLRNSRTRKNPFNDRNLDA